MKKSLLALAVLSAVAGAASAQTSVTIFGNIGGAVRHEQDAANGADKNRIRDASNYQTNSFGFRGVEDLGNGTNAHFVLDSTFYSGTGQQALATSFFDRQALVGITTQYGTIDLGRVFGPQFYAAISYDPFDTHYTGIDPITRNSISASQTSDNTFSSNSRTDNAINYTNKFGALTVRAEYAFGEIANAPDSGSTKAIGAVYQVSNFTLGGAYTKKKLRADNGSSASSNSPLGKLFGNDGTTVATAAPTGPFQDADYYTFGGSYTLGPVRASVGYAHEKRDQAASEHKERNLWGGLRYDMTPLIQLTGGYFKTNIGSARGDSRKDLFVLSAAYLLSKRTTLFAEADHSNFHGPEFPYDAIGQFVPSSVAGIAVKNGVMVGVNHSF